MSRLLERLKTNILVADGAMGTLLYTSDLDSYYETYNLTHPDKISAIHHAYLEAGADTIQTNIYAAKRHRLKGYAYDGQVREINQAGVKVAREAAGDDVFVFGTVGTLRGLKRYDLTLDEIIEETLEQVGYLIETNQIDDLLFEAYYNEEETIEVLKAVRLITDLPVITNVALHKAGIAENGRPLVETLGKLVMLGANVVGLNCHPGPYHIIKSLKQAPLFAQSYLSVCPNASLLSFIDDNSSGQYGFSRNTDYFGKSVELPVTEGACLIGGCCGTTPDHIRAVKRAAKGLRLVERKFVTPMVGEAKFIKAARQSEALVDRVKREVTTIAELDPPKTLDVARFTEGVGALDKAGISAITLADGSLAETRTCNASITALLKDGISTPFLLHLSCRDHNMIGLQSQLLGMDVLGFNHVLIITGDPSKIGDLPGATSVYDAASFKLLALIRQLNKGQGYSGASIRKKANFTTAAAFNSNIRNLPRCGRLVERKVATEADYFITQPVFNIEIINELADLTRDYEALSFVGTMPITDYNNTIFLHNEVSGIQLSDEFLAKLEIVKDGKEACQELILEESGQLIDCVLEHFNEIYLIVPFMRYDLTVELIDYIHQKVELES